jgi:GT2 family glycosyltransferase
MPPSASIIVCVYNRGRQVGACLASLLALDRHDFEIVLVDDGSTDDTPERLRQFQAEHPEAAVVIVRNPRNLGMSGARNVGIDAARGKFICFTDSDCTVEPGWLTALLAAFAAPDVAAAAGPVIDHPPRNYAESAYVGTNRIGLAPRQRRELVGCNMIFRREVAARYQFDTALTYYCDDDDMAWRLRSDGHRIAFAPAAIVHHDHPQRFRTYLRQAWRQGQGSARFWYKRGVYVGRDLVLLVAALLMLPLGLWDIRLLAVPAAFLGLQVAALVYNEAVLKGKGWFWAIRVLPLGLLYQCCKAVSVGATLLRLALGGEQAVRESRRRWRRHLPAEEPVTAAAPLPRPAASAGSRIDPSAPS